jgi:exosortase/archaeosortase family protein
LQVLNFNPLKVDSTTIYLDRFTLDVGVACSGLKLLIAVTAFTLFFMMIGGLKWWGNAIMVLAVLPLCLFINGLRIALIGVVGDTYGADAGHQFHDYSGYLTLIVCFFILFSLMRSLGWKD